MCICTIYHFKFINARGEKVIPRRRKRRRYHLSFCNEVVFKPQGIPMSDIEMIEIRADELEALKLCDSDGFDQVQAGESLGVSRGTIQRLLYSGRKKIIDAIINSNAIIIRENNTPNIRNL